ncbi:peroxiredoxin [Listeria ilorinensis]|uniref:peroxiredoxin n=1 Tax=Listeria ilorinensis TaxID=2867439 RepID=UPI001EF4DF87|nr:peroxiredoxin [Listeria ilorinensis]
MAERLVGMPAPRFELDAVMPDRTFGKVKLEDQMADGKWTVLFFYPMDFTFVCPTEIVALSARAVEFEQLDTRIIGVSTDSIHSHLVWTNMGLEEGGIGQLKFPLASDMNHQAARDYGVLIEEEGVALRGLFIINPEGEIQYEVVHHNNVGREVDEVLRVLQALQTGGLCPIDWQPGEQTIS